MILFQANVFNNTNIKAKLKPCIFIDASQCLEREHKEIKSHSWISFPRVF